MFVQCLCREPRGDARRRQARGGEPGGRGGGAGGQTFRALDAGGALRGSAGRPSSAVRAGGGTGARGPSLRSYPWFLRPIKLLFIPQDGDRVYGVN